VSTLELKVEGANKLRIMADALRKADREDLRKGLDRAIRKAARPTLDAIQEGARNIQTTGFLKPPSRFVNLNTTALTARQQRAEQVQHSSGLTGLVHRFTAEIPSHHTREKIAKAVTATITTAGENPRVSFRVSEARLPKVLKGMPRKFDSGTRWRHPVMGNREVWVDQISKPWFWKPIERHIKDFREAIDAELDIVRQKLEAS
jgi:hypothetical protein